MNERMRSKLAALPQYTAERLCLSVVRLLPSAFCLLLSAYCLLPSAFASSWTRQPSGTMAWLRSVYFLDQNRGWVAGSSGTLLQTTDGGTTWKKLLPLTKDTLDDVYFANDNVGWLIAERDMLKLKTNDEPRSYLLKTEDGGFSWRRIFLHSKDTNVRLVRLVFADNQRGWVFGETGVVFATRDGGAHWMRQASPTKHLLLGGAFAPDGRGLLVGAAATILQTNDGGANWQIGLVNDDNNARLTAVSFAGNSFGWAVGKAGQIFATRDAGRTWFRQKSNTELDLLDVKFINASEGWAVGADGLVLHTVDAGNHWFADSNSTSHSLQRLFAVDRDHVWIVGFGGTILKFGQSSPPQLKS
jgi:photosystem II stability/assembly factor-like uncharacterized protein